MKEILLILLLQLVYVPILTLRTIFVVKKKTTLAAILGFADTLIYVFGLSLVFSGDQSFLAMLVYAVGFGLGIIIGGFIEEKLALGYTVFSININNRNEELIQFLREKGFGVTLFVGEGRIGERYELSVLLPRNKEKQLMDYVLRYEPTAFLISYEPKRFHGGFMLEFMKKQNRN